MCVYIYAYMRVVADASSCRVRYSTCVIHIFPYINFIEVKVDACLVACRRRSYDDAFFREDFTSITLFTYMK